MILINIVENQRRYFNGEVVHFGDRRRSRRFVFGTGRSIGLFQYEDARCRSHAQNVRKLGVVATHGSSGRHQRPQPKSGVVQKSVWRLLRRAPNSDSKTLKIVSNLVDTGGGHIFPLSQSFTTN